MGFGTSFTQKYHLNFYIKLVRLIKKPHTETNKKNPVSRRERGLSSVTPARLERATNGLKGQCPIEDLKNHVCYNCAIFLSASV